MREIPQEETFDLDFGVAREAKRGEGEAVTKKEPRTKKGVTWKRFGKTLVAKPKCYGCVAEMQNGRKWSAPHPAVWERTESTGPGQEDSRAYCYVHGVPLRKADGVAEPER